LTNPLMTIALAHHIGKNPAIMFTHRIAQTTHILHRKRT